VEVETSVLSIGQAAVRENQNRMIGEVEVGWG
jgi:hypothetical protein